MQYAEVNVYTADQCKAFNNENVKDEHICGFLPGVRGACTGDSGGPLATTVNSVRVLLGVASFVTVSNNECLTSMPSVYTSIAYYRQWIDTIVPNL